jgi:predicted TIM-barrel fold metal-dependent hydrolase
VTDAALLCLENYLGCDRAQMFTALYFKENYKKINLRVFGSLYEFEVYKEMPFDEQVRRMMKLGCDGIKLMNMKPDVHKALGRGINHPDYEPMFALLEETGFPVVLHAADPEEFWGDPSGMLAGQVAAGWCYADGTYPSYRQIYDEVYEVLDRHPKLNITLAHFFFLSNDLPEAVRIMEKYENLHLDLTPGHEMYVGFSKDIPAWREFFKKYQHRILFGTDSTTTRPHDITHKKYDLVAQALSYDENEFPIPRNPEILVRGLHLDREIIENIAYNNFIDFAGEKAAPVNMEYARAEAKKLLEASKSYPELGRTVELLEEFLEKTK